jgi:putative transcriptional regulator
VRRADDVAQRREQAIEVHRRRAYDPDVSHPAGSLRGRLLVATPPLVDPHFDRTVVLLLEHGADGALGIILNRPSDTTLFDVLPEWREHASPPAVVFAGGPVTPEAVIALARGNDTEVDGWVEILDDLGSVDVGRAPDDLAPHLVALRVFAGYAGWAPGQLDVELEQGAWFVVDVHPDDAFTSTPDQLWQQVLRRQRGRIAMFAHCPLDASTN